VPGLGAAIPFTGLSSVVLDSAIFFLLLLPPLLFLEGWRIPKDALRRDAHTMLKLAPGLVVFTVVGMGFFIHWVIPSMALALCVALAAVISPTDAGGGLGDRGADADSASPDAHPAGPGAVQRRHGSGVHALRSGGSDDGQLFAGRGPG